MHESRSFIAKGTVSNIFFDFIHQVVPSVSSSHLIIAQVYNFIYLQVFNLIWKPRCNQVITLEQMKGITNHIKRNKMRLRQRPSASSKQPFTQLPQLNVSSRLP